MVTIKIYFPSKLKVNLTVLSVTNGIGPIPLKCIHSYDNSSPLTFIQIKHVVGDPMSRQVYIFDDAETTRAQIHFGSKASSLIT